MIDDGLTTKERARRIQLFWEGKTNTPEFKALETKRNKYLAEKAESEGKKVTYVANDGSATLPEIQVTGQKPIQKPYWSDMTANDWIDAGITAASFVPGLDTAADIADTANQFRQGNWGWGLVGLASTLLPGVSSNHFRKGFNWVRNGLIGKYLDKSLNTNNIKDVVNRFRGTEWNSFLQSKNGDAYYALQNKEYKNLTNPKEKFFISHTTPWEEFLETKNAGLDYGASAHLINNNKILYEFPTETFGNLRASSSKPNYPLRNVSVIDQGKKHLLYGDTSSGYRGKVRIMDDETAKILEADPFSIGISDRPLKRINGEELYDISPEYEDIFQGNQTTVSARDLHTALNKEHTTYIPTEAGIQKNIYIGTPTKTNQGSTIDLSKTADFSKAQSNIQLLDIMDEFAEKYGYPKSDRSTILSNRKTNKQARDLIARHNTYLRGVQPYGSEPGDLELVQEILGKNITSEEFMKYAATHNRPNYKGMWISPASNAFIYGGDGKTAFVRRNYKLGKNRNNWFTEGDFNIKPNPVEINKSWDNATGIIAPWYSHMNKGGENELVSIEDLNFAGWADFYKNWKQKVSLNDMVSDREINIGY